MTATLRGLYAISAGATGAALLDWGRAVLHGGAMLVQYRDKRDDVDARRRDAEALLALCRVHSVPLLVNDDITLAAAIGADGCHVGRDDGSVAEARARLGPRAIVGVSSYADLARAETAAAGGATYVAFGSVFPSATKPDAPPASLELLRAARHALDVPVCAIGGITVANAPRLLDAGADLLAVINELNHPPGPEAVSKAFARLFGDT